MDRPSTHSPLQQWRFRPPPLPTRLLSETQWLMRMMGIANKLISIFGSMRWDLLLFEDDCLVLSDHPVVEWPLGISERRPGRVPSGHGALNLLEIRVPLSPRSALLMTWQDTADGQEPVVGRPEQAANLNAFSVEPAEKQWMYPTGASPQIASGSLLPLSPEIFSEYLPLVVEASAVRAEVSRRVNSRLGEDRRNEFEIVTASQVD